MRSSLVFLFAILCFNQLNAQEPDSALWHTVNNPYVFSSVGFESETAEFIVTVLDDQGNPVPENTPVAISIDRGTVTGSSLFKQELSGNENSAGGVFYFKTDSNGELRLGYKPGSTPPGFTGFKKNLLLQFPDSSDTFFWQKYDEQYVLKPFQFSSLVVKVNIPDPANESTAQLVANIPLKAASTLPILVGPDLTVIETTSKTNDQYIFSSENANPQTANLDITVWDSRGNRVPRGTPINLELNFGTVQSDQIFHTQYNTGGQQFSALSGINGYGAAGGDVFLRTKEDGKLLLKYIAPQMVPPPFSDWYGQIFEQRGYTQEQAWEFYSMHYWEIPEGFEGTGFGAIDEVAAYQTFFGEPSSNASMSIDSSMSKLPVLIGPDKITINTSSIHGDEYVFASSTTNQSADVSISVTDSRGNAVPTGTVIMMIIDDFPGGKLVGRNIIHYTRIAVNENRGELAPISSGTGAFVRLGRGGKATLTYQTPNDNFSPKALHNVRNFTFDQFRRALGLLAFPAYFGCGIQCLEPDNPNWIGEIPWIIEASENSKVPVIIGAEQATVTVKPDTIKAGKIYAGITGIVKDFRGKPVPSGTNIMISASKGFVPVSTVKVNLVAGDDGKVRGSYLSDTRPILQSPNTVDIDISAPVDINDIPRGGWLLGRGKLVTQGGAKNRNSYRVGQYLLGFSVVDAVSNLNPLKALGSMRKFRNNADALGRNYKNLLNKVGDGTATSADYDAYRQGWTDVRTSITNLVKDVPGTSLTGPNLQGGQIFTGLIVNGARKTLINTAREKLVKEPLNKAALDFIEFSFNEANVGQLKFIPKAPQAAAVQQFFIDPDLQFRSQLWSLPSATGAYELFGVKFALENADSLIRGNILEVGDQAPILDNSLPSAVSIYRGSDRGVESPGFFEITSIDTEKREIEGVAIFVVFRQQDESQEFITSNRIGAKQDTLQWLDDTQVIFADSVVTDSTDFFFGPVIAPNPFNADLGISIDEAFVLGSLASADSALQNVSFTKDVKVSFIDSTVSKAVNQQPFMYNEANSTWEMISTTEKVGDTLNVTLSETGIIGFANMATIVNEPPLLTSLSDTSITSEQVLSTNVTFSDPENDNLTVTVSSDTSAVPVSINGNTLTADPEDTFTGVATITVSLFDGVNTSSSSFDLMVNILNQAPVLESLSDTLIASGTMLMRNLSASDPNGDPLTITAVSDTNAVQVSVDESVLTVTPDGAFLGTSVITVRASDGIDTTSVSFTLTVNVSTSTDEENEVPRVVELFQNYPNPFNPTTNIEFNLPAASDVKLQVYDLLGREVVTLVNGRRNAGRFTVTFDASRLASGIYIYRLQAGQSIITRKLTLIK